MSNNDANKMRYIGTRIDNTLHEKIEQYLEKHGLSMSEFMRTSVESSEAQSVTLRGDALRHLFHADGCIFAVDFLRLQESVRAW
jgi:hypothetical protein